MSKSGILSVLKASTTAELKRLKKALTLLTQHGYGTFETATKIELVNQMLAARAA